MGSDRFGDGLRMGERSHVARALHDDAPGVGEPRRQRALGRGHDRRGSAPLDQQDGDRSASIRPGASIPAESPSSAGVPAKINSMRSVW